MDQSNIFNITNEIYQKSSLFINLDFFVFHLTVVQYNRLHNLN